MSAFESTIPFIEKFVPPPYRHDTEIITEWLMKIMIYIPRHYIAESLI